MAGEVAISINQLRELVSEVQKTQRSLTLHLADGVVAVVKPERKTAPGVAKRRQGGSRLSSRSVEQVFGAVPTPPHLIGKDLDAMIREAKEERAAHFLKQQ